MRTTAIGDTGVELTELGIGTAPHGGLYSVVTEEMAVGAVHAALEAGCNYIDTAPLYGYGRAEMYLSTALSDVPPDRYVVSTKIGRVLDPIDPAVAREDKFFLNPAPNTFHWGLQPRRSPPFSGRQAWKGSSWTGWMSSTSTCSPSHTTKC